MREFTGRLCHEFSEGFVRASLLSSWNQNVLNGISDLKKNNASKINRLLKLSIIQQCLEDIQI